MWSGVGWLGGGVGWENAVAWHVSPIRPQPPLSSTLKPLNTNVAPPLQTMQVWQAEVDDAAGKAIQRYLSRALRDDGGGGDTTDINPLLRRGRHKLSSSNPLL